MHKGLQRSNHTLPINILICKSRWFLCSPFLPLSFPPFHSWHPLVGSGIPREETIWFAWTTLSPPLLPAFQRRFFGETQQFVVRNPSQEREKRVSPRRNKKNTYFCPRFCPIFPHLTLCTNLHDDGRSHYPPAVFIAVGVYQRSFSVRIPRCSFVIALQSYPNPVHPTPFGVFERRRTVPQANPTGFPTQKAGGATRKREAIPSPAVVGRPLARAPTPGKPAL